MMQYVKQTMRRSLEKDNLLETVALHRRNRRLPVLSYVFQNVVQKVLAELWVASDYDETKKITVSVEQEYLRSLANGEGELTVYVCGAKQAKVIDEGNYYPPSKMVFLNLSSL